MIRFESVTKTYPDGTVAVDALDLEAQSGKITVLVGPSGCGKTTSLRMINRMIEPTSGQIWLDDRDTASFPAHELRRRIGYVIQHAGLFPHRTIIDNIATVPYLLGWDKKKARARTLELLELDRRQDILELGDEQSRIVGDGWREGVCPPPHFDGEAIP